MMIRGCSECGLGEQLLLDAAKVAAVAISNAKVAAFAISSTRAEIWAAARLVN